jgi:hypothetical protein
MRAGRICFDAELANSAPPPNPAAMMATVAATPARKNRNFADMGPPGSVKANASDKQGCGSDFLVLG